MFKLEFHVFRLLFLIIYLKYVTLVPHKYCLSPLNRSDCGIKPTAVFSYFKPGSRCEIETWRGCPTANMFENEFHCSHYCLGRLKYFGRGKGSWTGKHGESIYDLDMRELEELYRLLYDTDIAQEIDDDDYKEDLKNTSPFRPKVIEINDDTENTVVTETAEDEVTTTEDIDTSKEDIKTTTEDIDTSKEDIKTTTVDADTSKEDIETTTVKMATVTVTRQWKGAPGPLTDDIIMR